MSNLHEIEKSVDPLAFGQDVCAILDAETVDRAILVCQSLGGTHGVRFAYEFPDRVDCVVMSNTFAGLTDGTKTDSDAECDGDILHRYGQALASRSHGDVGLELRNEELEKFMKLLHHPITHIEGKRLPVPDRAKRAKRQADSKPELAMLSAMMTQSNINLPSSAAPARMMAEAAVELKDFRGKYQGPVHFIATLSDPVMMWEILAYSAAKLKGKEPIRFALLYVFQTEKTNPSLVDIRNSVGWICDVPDLGRRRHWSLSFLHRLLHLQRPSAVLLENTVQTMICFRRFFCIYERLRSLTPVLYWTKMDLR